MINPVQIAVLAAITYSSSTQTTPLGKPGTQYHYKLIGDMSARPKEAVEKGTIVTSAVFTIGPTAHVKGKVYQWFEIAFTRANGRSYSALLLIDRWPTTSAQPSVARYLWHEPDWPDYLEYVNETTGKPVLPRFSIWKYSWPQTADGQSPVSLEKSVTDIQLHGWPFKLVKKTSATLKIPSKTTIIKLNPDLIIGLTGVHRDADGRHLQSLGVEHYNFIDPPQESDFRQDIEAGINLCASSSHFSWIWRTNCYTAQMYIMPDDWPANLYRSNYWGRAFLSDEPAIHNAAALNNNPELAGKLTPREAAQALEKLTMENLNRLDNNYGNRILGSFVDKVFGKGSLDIVERDYPVWEAVWQASWYHLAPEGSACGVVDEDIYPDGMIAELNATFGTQIPLTIENACAIRIAVGRGAARNFGKRWGTAIYAYARHSLNPQIDLTSLKIMYDAGATYFWHWFGWPGMDAAVVPYSYKRAYAAAVRQFYRENPNRDMDKLLRAADTCIVIPYGFTLTPYPMLYIQWLHMERTTEQGVTYRQILRNAALEIERCLRNGIKFDIAVDDPRFKPSGYRELVYCLEDGTVKIVSASGATKRLKEARTPQRPDLGPMPTVRIQVLTTDPVARSTVKLKAEGKPGTGELFPGDQKGYTVWWEVFKPNNGFTNLSGEETSFEADMPGLYRVRAAVVDCFGRPAYDETTINVMPNPNEPPTPPNK